MATCAAEETTKGRKALTSRPGLAAAMVSQGTEVHYCTRPEGHTGGHLCPCGYYWGGK